MFFSVGSSHNSYPFHNIVIILGVVRRNSCQYLGLSYATEMLAVNISSVSRNIRKDKLQLGEQKGQAPTIAITLAVTTK